MRYLINYANGAVQYANKIDVGIMVSLLSAGQVMNVVDVRDKTALIINSSSEGKKDIGWAEMSEFGVIPEEGRKKLEKK